MLITHLISVVKLPILLVSVNNTESFWNLHGFKLLDNKDLESYGENANLMINFL